MSEKRGRRVILVDGHSLAYRAFFALPDTMMTSGGQPTNAVYGFTSMLLKVLDEEKPDAVVVAFDGPRSELKRTRDYPEYKAHRPKMPDELREQVSMIDNLLGSMNIPTTVMPGYEADDILGTIAKRVASTGGEAVIVTGDRDTLQLVGEGVGVLMTGRGITETESFDRDAVIEKYGLPPEMIPDMVGLKGDSSDNIPGVPGIGEKGASALIKQFGTLEGLYEHLEEVSGAKRKKALEDGRDVAFLSRELAIIDRDVPIELDVGEIKLSSWDRQEVIDHLNALEFKTLARRFLEMFPGGGAPEGGAEENLLDYRLVDATDPEATEDFVREARESGAVALAALLSGNGYCEVDLESLALATGDRVLLVRTGVDGEESPALGAARAVLELEVELWFHDAKPTVEALDKAGLHAGNVTFDTMLAAYLENPSLGTYHLWDLWEKNLGERVGVDGRVEKVEEQASLIPEESDADYGIATDAARIFHLKPVLAEKIEMLGMKELFEEVEMPLMMVLKDMEETGVALELPVIERLGEEAGGNIARLEGEIQSLAGHEFNVGSTKQLAHVLFEEMGIPPVKKTKTGFSTDSSVLETLKEEYEIAGKIVDYREFAKLKSTYFDVLPALVCTSTGRIHCSFNQTVTATGRISSSNPNLQNIPVRTEVGRRIREGFVPPGEGWKMLVADYSQIELRVLAHMSEDEMLLDAFSRDQDIHRETASKIFGVPIEEVTSEQRRMAKVVNFGIVYGMGYYGLSSRLGISMEQATDFIDTYFDKYPGVRDYRDRCVEEATERGYAETLLGRRRYIPQLKSKNRQTRELGERLAVNTPLQGTAADIIKQAMVDVDRAVSSAGMRSRMTLQIHDELIFDVALEEISEMTTLVRRHMTGAFKLKVDLKVDIGAHDNWGQAK